MCRVALWGCLLILSLAACGTEATEATSAGTAGTTTMRATTEPIGVASDIPEEWSAEIEALRDSAGSGRIVGFVSLGAETSTGPPASPSQPVCVGVGEFSDIQPGAVVKVLDIEGNEIGESVMRGSAYDGHHGCSLWFGVDVPTDLLDYQLAVAGHNPNHVDRATLDQFGWTINLWSDQPSMFANCEELEPDADPMTCLLLT